MIAVHLAQDSFSIKTIVTRYGQLVLIVDYSLFKRKIIKLNSRIYQYNIHR